MNLLYALSDVIFFIMYYVIRYRRKIVFNNLTGSFPEKSKAEIRHLERKFYVHFSNLMIESLKNLSDSGKTIEKRMNFINIELMKTYHSQGKSIILYAAHFGNWEWLAILPFFVSYRMIAFYQPLSNSLFDELIKKSREKYGITAVPSAHAYKALKTYNDEGELTLSLVLGDQSPPRDSTKVWLNFLNRETAFIVGAGKMAKKLDHVVVFPHFTKKARGYYDIEFKVIHADEDENSENPYIKGYARELEKSIRINPDLWLWSHRRWKLNQMNMLN